MPFRIAIIGAGIVGLATARSLQRQLPAASLIVIEHEPAVARHQTGRNSGVIHSGIYSTPGSLKARTCEAGRRLLEAFCDDRGIAWSRCGKVIVATDDRECEALEGILERGRANGIACTPLTRTQLSDREPRVRGRAAIFVADTGVVDYGEVSRALAEEIRGGGELLLGTTVRGIRTRTSGIRILLDRDHLDVDLVVTCCGLHADRMARSSGLDTSLRILPFRGEYWTLKPPADALVRHLVYPVADPNMPFLGVHFTRGIDGRVEAGPSAVPALAREGYGWRDLSPRDVLEAGLDLRTWRLGRRWWKAGVREIHRSLSRRAAWKDMRRLLPDLRIEDLVRGRSGVRAQAVDPRGRLVDDFVIRSCGNMVHVLNAPSPAATASLAIGDHVSRHVIDRLHRRA